MPILLFEREIKCLLVSKNRVVFLYIELYITRENNNNKKGGKNEPKKQMKTPHLSSSSGAGWRLEPVRFHKPDRFNRQLKLQPKDCSFN